MESTEETKKKIALRSELRNKTTGYVLTALGLVAGLAWNDAISSAIKVIFPLGSNGLIAKFIYAAIITIVIVMVSTSLMRVLEPKEC